MIDYIFNKILIIGILFTLIGLVIGLMFNIIFIFIIGITLIFICLIYILVNELINT